MSRVKKVAVVKSASGMGQPSIIITEKQLLEIEEMAVGMTIEQIANYFGFCRDTFYNICERNPAVLRHYKKGKSVMIKETVGHLMSKIREGDSASIFFYLKTQAGWRETKDINISNEDGSLRPIKQIVVRYEDGKGNHSTKMVNAIEGKTV